MNVFAQTAMCCLFPWPGCLPIACGAVHGPEMALALVLSTKLGERANSSTLSMAASHRTSTASQDDRRSEPSWDDCTAPRKMFSLGSGACKTSFLAWWLRSAGPEHEQQPLMRWEDLPEKPQSARLCVEVNKPVSSPFFSHPLLLRV